MMRLYRLIIPDSALRFDYHDALIECDEQLVWDDYRIRKAFDTVERCASMLRDALCLAGAIRIDAEMMSL